MNRPTRKAERAADRLRHSHCGFRGFRLFDIGYKTEGVLPLAPFQSAKEEVKPGDKFARGCERPQRRGLLRAFAPEGGAAEGLVIAWRRHFADKAPIVGTVTGVVKGGLTVDVGVRAFLPASRSGARDAAELEKLVGQQIRSASSSLKSRKKTWWSIAACWSEEEDRSTKETEVW